MGFYGRDPEATAAGRRRKATVNGQSRWLWMGMGAFVSAFFVCILAAVAFYFLVYREHGPGPWRNPLIAIKGDPGPAPQPPGGKPTLAPPGAAVPTATPLLSAIPPSATEMSQATAGSGTAQEAASPTIGAITFAGGIDESGEPKNPGGTFPTSTTEVYAFFEYSGIPKGAAFERVWYLDDKETMRGNTPWSEGESGKTHIRIYAENASLEPGKYRLELNVAGTLVQTGTFTIKKVAAAPTKKTNGQIIVYSIWDGEKYQLRVMDMDGNNDRWIFGPADSPSWNPDGTMVSIFAEEGAKLGNGLYIVTADGSMMGNRYVGDANVRYPHWSPDGTRITYDSQRGGGTYQIYICELSRGVENCESWGPHGEFPAWSPQSDRIVYRNCDGGECTLGIVNVSGSDWNHGSKTRIPNTGDDLFPVWSPDGSQIAFARKLSESNYDIYVINVDGSGLKQLTDDPALDVLPAWTPDGRLLFRSSRDDKWSIYVVNRDGTELKKIKDAPAGPDWGRAGISAALGGK